VRFLLRNWHLKLGAVALATVLYTGLVFSESFTESRLLVPVDTIGQPEGFDDASGIFVLTPPPNQVEVVYRALNQVASVEPSAFRATVDLADYDMDRVEEPQPLELRVEALLEGVQVTSWEPRIVNVALDVVDEKRVPIRVDTGEVPETLSVGEPEVTVDDEPISEVRAVGPSSLLGQVDHAVARVRVQPSGINLEGDVELEAVDARGQPVANVDLDPQTVRVQVDVSFVETTTTVVVRPVIEGTPGAGFLTTSLTVEPSVVTLRGLPGVLDPIREVLTEPLSIAGATSDQVFEAQLALPDDTRLAEGSASGMVTVTVTIEPSVSSRTFVSGIICEGAGQNACLPGLDQVAVTLSGPGDVLSGLTAGEVQVVLNVSGLPPGQHTVSPALPALPEGVELEAISPAAVPVTIQAPATPAPAPTPTPAPTPEP
jgi:YbbR domain-containing protein